MSVVYLAIDTRLNRNWAVKEVKKAGNGINDDIVIGSILAEANLIKSLDHPALPRIVDIIDREDCIYIVMDFIEGESLDKIIRKTGPASEEQVMDWGLQVCDILTYLHSLNPPIVYRDMKPANLMLKPNGRLAVIDFGIAGEYDGSDPGDTSILGTKGYAPPEQYKGYTDKRSDIYALGMTMYHLLTGNEPEAGSSGPEWDVPASEGMEYIIRKCTEPDPEDRYQSCEELRKDMENPAGVTASRRNALRRRIAGFVASMTVFALSLTAGVACNASALQIKDSEYSALLNAGDVESLYRAVETYPGREEAYEALVTYCGDHFVVNKDLNRLGNTVNQNAAKLGDDSPVYYDVGRLIFSEWNGTFKGRVAVSASFFRRASKAGNRDRRNLSECYYKICSFMTGENKTSEHSAAEYRKLLEEMKESLKAVEERNDTESNYDRLSLCYVITLFIDSQSVNMSALGLGGSEIRNLLESAHNSADSVDSTLPYVLHLQEKMKNEYKGVSETVDLFFKTTEAGREAGERK